MGRERKKKKGDIDIFCLVEFYRKEREREEVVSLKEAPSTSRGLSSTLFVEQLWLSYDKGKSRFKDNNHHSLYFVHGIVSGIGY